MESRWGTKGAAAPDSGRPRRYADQPSFSSTLLDAIYKSMDEPGDGAAEALAAAAKTRKREEASHYNHYYKASLAGSYRASSRVNATTSSSSECSSYGGFSSSEAESSQQHRRLRPIRTSAVAGGAAAPSAPEKKANKKQDKPAGAAIRARLRDLRAKPASPGARLAGFLNSIFAGSKRGGDGGPATPPRAAESSACSTASSSYSRSCLSKTPSTRGGGQTKRTVRFMDVEAPAERRGSRVQVGVVHLEEMLLRRMEMESDDDEEDSSDASSDLFELENLAAVSPAAGVSAATAAYRDELPVYETTRVVLNRGIGDHGHARSTARVV